PDALTAINLVMPLTTFVTALSTLIGLGPAIMAAKFIGKRQTEKVNSIYSSALYQAILIGGLQSVLLWVFLPQVGDWLCSNGQLLPYLMNYIEVLPFSFFLLMIVDTLISLIEADGHPNLASKAVFLGCVLNVMLDVVLVKHFSFGTQGLALAMTANYLTVLLYFLFRMRREGVSYQWTKPKRSTINVTKAGLKEGMPMMINDLLYSLMIFGVNSLLLIHYGENELYFWAIFLQLLLLVMVIVDCAEGAVLSIGSVLEGEDDKFGLRALVKRIWIQVSSIVLLIVFFIWLFPTQIALLFGDSNNVPSEWPQAVRILSLMLVPYALTTFMRSVFQVLGNRLTGVFFSLGQFVLIVGSLYLSTRWNKELLWWCFPIAAWLLFGMQMLYLLIVSHVKKISNFSIIPLSPKKNFLDLSVAYNNESVTEATQHVCHFLQKHKVDTLTEIEINICCEELMTNIVQFQTYKTRSYMDLSIALEEHRVFLVLKDSGRPFIPVLPSSNPDPLEEDNVPLGLYLVNRVCTEISHKYMYGLNVVIVEFDRRAQKRY
ncbi:MAG: MATE family efflux transporter, partial [Bacillota bacterium]|nr:MATE family efflux transporter [Bacillota bacterium]